MTFSPELLRFFRAEAAEYLDTIDGLVTKAWTSGMTSEAGAFVAAARALRGSATMARVSRIAEIAFALERIGNALRDSDLVWTPTLADALRGTTADVRDLVSVSPRWTSEDDQRATRRVAALRRFMPNDSPRPTPPSPAAATAPFFIALQCAAIASDLDALTSGDDARAVLENVISRVRSLLGISGLNEHPALVAVSSAVETSLREFAPDALLSDSETTFVRNAAAAFRRASADLRARGRLDSQAREIVQITSRPAPVLRSSKDNEAVVPVDELFFTDGGPHLVTRGQGSTETPDMRFRRDIVPLAERVRECAVLAAAASDGWDRDRARRGLASAIEPLERLARSYNAQQVAAFFGDAARGEGPGGFDRPTLVRLEAGADVLLTHDVPLAEMEQRLAVLARGRPTPPFAAAPTRPAERADTPSQGASGKTLHDMLASSLAGLRSLEEQPLSEPARTDDDRVVPMEDLLYRGDRALARAVEIRDALRTSATVDQDLLHELYDLLDLARAG